jgi:hypothetical protein
LRFSAEGARKMTPHMKIGIAGVVVGLILLIISPWLALGVIAAAVLIKRSRGRRQIGG